MKEFEDAMLDLSWENLKYEMDRFKNINNKAMTLITINGALASLLVGMNNANANGCPFFYIIAMFCLAFSIIICIYSLRSSKLKTLSSEYLIRDLYAMEHANQIRGIVTTVAAVETNFKKGNYRKSLELDFAIGALGIGAILLLIYSTTLVF